ncbi:ribulose-phosphate 3-epimerase [Paramicrobacterium chengjingii]|uniref:Ribulose-phosphate 3-epimerase n=1 Tax=Paramicrobacterium chengjingii TaxID=2769067 RepID=A0ABX6YMB1_9MICO|nr:ribulose-phosphate 3-epimerase [Microbacterium chengjingii]QPZ39983.1 ribulose-phosphate 3-epimerase [Microbacterium chengjingii]
MSMRINPSILSADFVNFERDLGRIANADLVHVDVMDNHFVPNLTFGLPMVQRIQEVSPIPLDVHLMIDDADRWAPDYAETGAFSVTFHAEAASDPVGLARKLRQIGARAGIALKPGTEVGPYLELLPEFDQVLVMTVEPGFGGQSFKREMMPKLTAVRAAADRTGLDIWLQVDGGVTLDTIEVAAENGADTFVAGSSVFSGGEPADQIRMLRERAAAHSHR